MKKLLLLAMMGLVLFPTNVLADQYQLKDQPSANPKPPVRSPYLVEASIDPETGELSIYVNYDITCLYVTIEQNNVVLDSFSQPLYNGVSTIYSFAGYSTGEYIVTLSTVDGMIAQYLVTVTDD